ncbi:transposase [bacterium]|nr:transposase [bacterium]
MIQPKIPPPKPGGRPRKTDVLKVIKAIFYLLRAGCAWRLLPHDFPPWQTVYTYFRQRMQDSKRVSSKI